jgi:hypothetical protein
MVTGNAKNSTAISSKGIGKAQKSTAFYCLISKNITILSLRGFDMQK